jgi:hypothetical protein
VRSVHVKSHGVLYGTITVESDLPAVLAPGLFSTDGSYPVVIRFSTLPGDSISTPRGLAVEIVGVEGDRLHGSEGFSSYPCAITESMCGAIRMNGPAQ